MKRLFTLVSLLLAACASLLGPRDIEVPLARLQEGLERRFPFSQRYLGLFDVSAVNPKLALQPDVNRITATMDLSVTPVLALGRGVRGSLTLSGVPRVDTARHLLVLGDPRVDDIRIPGLDYGYGAQLAGIASFVAAQLLGDLPVYSFTPDAFRYAGVSFAPVKIATRPDSLVVTFAPVK
jgi:hypothetical protein